MCSKYEKKEDEGLFANLNKESEEKPRKGKYDDNAFQRDLEQATKIAGQATDYNTDDVDVAKIIRSALQIEDESRQLKGQKAEPLYQEFKMNKESKQTEKERPAWVRAPQVKDKNLKKV